MHDKFYAFSFLLFILSVPFARGSGQDSTITIIAQKNAYTFFRDKETGSVQVRESRQTQYKSSLAVDLPLAEFYNDNSKIVSFACRVNNKSVRDFKPLDTYYAVKDVFHSDTRVRYFPVPVPANGTVDFSMEKITLNSLYFTSLYFTDDFSIGSKEIVLKVPRALNIAFKELNFEGYTIKKTVSYLQNEDADLITYQAAALPGEVHDVNSPGHSHVYPHLLVLSGKTTGTESPAYFGSTQDQYNWYIKLIAGLNEEKTAEIVQQANEITAKKASELEKVKAVFYWVQENIRYIAFEDGLAGFRPDKATEVLRKKYGDCKGMANLTRTLLKALGFDARLCWLGTSHISYDYSTPSLAVDNHMICAVLLKGQTYFLDATENYLGFNEYADRIQGRQVLIEDGAKYLLKNIPATGGSANLDVQQKALAISGTDLVGSVKQVWKGEEKEYVLSRAGSSKKEDQQKDLSAFLSNGNQNYGISELHFSDLANYDQDLSAVFKLHFKNGLDKFDKSYYLSIDFDKEYNNSVIDSARKTDYLLPYKTTVSREVVLEIPENYAVSDKPENLLIRNKNYEFTISYEIKEGKILYRKRIQILNPWIRKAEFPVWNSDIKTLSEHYNQTITLSPKS